MVWRRCALWFAVLWMGCRGQASDGSVIETPFCRKVRACLRDALPEVYRASMHDLVASKAAGCLGSDARSLWTTRDCLPFEFARDESSGLGVRAAIDCTEGCPLNTAFELEYTEPVAPFECACLGATPRFERDPFPARFDPLTANGGYRGCVPTARAPSQRLAARVSREGASVVAAPGDVAARALGFEGTSVVLAVDGVPIVEPADLDRVLTELPGRVPASLALTNSRVLHYPPREAFEELARIAKEVDFAHIGVRAGSCADSATKNGQITLGARAVAYEPSCDNDASRRLEPLAAAIRRASEHALARRVRAPYSAVACKELRSLPTVASLRVGERTVELRYVDWLVR